MGHFDPFPAAWAERPVSVQLATSTGASGNGKDGAPIPAVCGEVTEPPEPTGNGYSMPRRSLQRLFHHDDRLIHVRPDQFGKFIWQEIVDPD